MLADNRAVLTNDDAVSIGVDLDRPANGTGGDRVLVVVEPNQASLRDRRLRRVESIEWASNRHQLGPLGLKSLPDRGFGQLGMFVGLGIGHTAIELSLIHISEPTRRS